jgi:hypothetical protein
MLIRRQRWKPWSEISFRNFTPRDTGREVAASVDLDHVRSKGFCEHGYESSFSLIKGANFLYDT